MQRKGWEACLHHPAFANNLIFHRYFRAPVTVLGKSLDCHVAVVAGPYRLSAEVHLKAKGIAGRVFGEPMEFWANKMPEGMLLRFPRTRGKKKT
jgi:hypothetical protein